MTVLKNLLVFLACLAAVAGLVAFVLPSRWEVERDIVINNSPGEVHAVVSDMYTWELWSPWGLPVDGRVKMDAQNGEERKLSWSGPEVGRGELRVTANERAEHLVFVVDLGGGRDRIGGRFDYQAEYGGATRVTFTLSGDVHSNPFARYLALSRGYTQGPRMAETLTRLKRRVETGR
jgi:hypothetical protein